MTVTERDPNQTEPLPVPQDDSDPYARPCTGARARLTREPVTERVTRWATRAGAMWLEPAALKVWKEELAAVRRYTDEPPYCASNSALRHIAKAWLPVAVLSLASKHASAWLMRRSGRACTFGGLAVLLWAVWPGPWSIWIPVVIALWLFT